MSAAGSDPGAGYAVVAAVRADPGDALVALDFDGTLSALTVDPATSRLVDGARDVILRLLRAGIRVCIVSGRPAADVVRLGGLSDVAGLRVLGQYGLQEWVSGELRSPEPEPGIASARERLTSVLAEAPAGVVVEDKELALVVHSRGAAEPQHAIDELFPALRALADEVGLETVPGRFVVELRPPGVDKGAVLRRLVAELAPRVVVYAGDDLGDLPAFDVVTELRDTGDVMGVAIASVTEGEAVPDVEQRADLTVDGPAGLVDWLAQLAA